MSEPMIKLDPSGSAPVVDYRLPDSTSYAGRHYLVLDLPAQAFRPEQGLDDGALDRVRPREVRNDISIEDLAIPGVLAVEENASGDLTFRTPRFVDDSLANLRKSDLATMRRSGLRAIAARDLIGGVGLRIGPSEDSDPPGDEIDAEAGPAPAVFALVVTAPTEGGTLSVPGATMTAIVRGSVILEGIPGPVREVRVRLGSANAWTAATRDDGVTWDQWTAKVPISESGNLQLTAHASLGGGRDDSAAALSQHTPVRPIERSRSSSPARSAICWLVYWQPRSA